MSYLVLAGILLVVMLSLIALFDEARESVRSVKHRSEQMDKRKKIKQALSMRGQLHKIDPDDFQKWIVYIYESMGHRTKTLSEGKETSILLEKNGVYTLVGYKNYVWPIGREMLEIFDHKKKQMELDRLIFISTGGFNVNAWEWAGERPSIELVSEEKLFALSKEMAPPQKGKQVPTKTSA